MVVHTFLSMASLALAMVLVQQIVREGNARRHMYWGLVLGGFNIAIFIFYGVEYLDGVNLYTHGMGNSLLAYVSLVAAINLATLLPLRVLADARLQMIRIAGLFNLIFFFWAEWHRAFLGRYVYLLRDLFL